MTENDIASVVVDAALKIHKTLGPGLLESVYQATLSFELRKRAWLLSSNLPFQCATSGNLPEIDEQTLGIADQLICGVNKVWSTASGQ